MKYSIIFKFVTLFAVLLSMQSLFATNITIWDEDGAAVSGQGGEDQETEPGMINNQNWDLEGFFLNGNLLSVTSGFNLQSGYSYGGHLYTAGDIFLDINNNAQFGTQANRRALDVSRPNYGYDYALDINWSALTYDVYQLKAGGSNLVQVSESGNFPESDPFQLNFSGETFITSGVIGYASGLTNAQSSFLGGTHYSASGFDLGFLAPGANFTAHLTISCGNDNLMGQGQTAVPEPSTLILLGLGFLGLLRLRKKS